jgi:stage II sporulation SpoAA-like protein
MIQCEVLSDRNIVIVTPEGPLETADFEQLGREIEPLITANGKLAGLMIRIQAFPGWRDFAAVGAHVRFVAAHQRRIERIAAVTDSAFLKIVPHIAAVFVHPQIRTFGFDEKDQALAWLQTGRLPAATA